MNQGETTPVRVGHRVPDDMVCCGQPVVQGIVFERVCAAGCGCAVTTRFRAGGGSPAAGTVLVIDSIRGCGRH